MLAYRYDAIVDECMALAAVWRDRITNGVSDRAFYADQHRRSLLRAARFARLAQKARGEATAQGMAPCENSRSEVEAEGWQPGRPSADAPNEPSSQQRTGSGTTAPVES